MNQSCYFAKICDREFIKKHISNLFLLHLRVHEKRLTILCEKKHKMCFKMLEIISYKFYGDSEKF